EHRPAVEWQPCFRPHHAGAPAAGEDHEGAGLLDLFGGHQVSTNTPERQPYPIGHTPAGQRFSFTWAMISSGKCCSAEMNGAGATWPRPQMEVRRIASANSSISATSSGRP